MSKLKDDLRASIEPDLSSSRWGTRKRKVAQTYQEPEYAPPRSDGPTGHEPEVQQSLDWQTSQAIDMLTPELPAFAEDYEAEYRALVEEEPDIDVDFVSPPQRGPLIRQSPTSLPQESAIVPDFSRKCSLTGHPLEESLAHSHCGAPYRECRCVW